MAVKKFPAPGQQVRVLTGMGHDLTGVCLYHLSSQWVILTDDNRELVVHSNDTWSYVR